MNKKILLLFWRGIVYLSGLGALVYYLYNSPYNPHPHTAGELRSWIAGFGALAPLIYIGIYTLRPLLLFPTLLLNLSAGILFGPWWGTVLVLAGGLCCACFCYFLGRFGGGRWLLDNFGGRWGERLREYLVASGSFSKLLWLRTVPVFPYDPVSIMAGSVLFPVRTYMAATLLGMVPGAIAYNFLTDAFGTPKFYAAVAVAVLAFGAPLVMWHMGGEGNALAKYAKGKQRHEE